MGNSIVQNILNTNRRHLNCRHFFIVMKLWTCQHKTYFLFYPLNSTIHWRSILIKDFNTLPNFYFEMKVSRVIVQTVWLWPLFFFFLLLLLHYECSSQLRSPHLALVEFPGWGVSIWACVTLICAIMSVCSNQRVNPMYSSVWREQ